MARVMVAGQRDACHSHGLFRLLTQGSGDFGDLQQGCIGHGIWFL
jgi:hypothetical protein